MRVVYKLAGNVIVPVYAVGDGALENSGYKSYFASGERRWQHLALSVLLLNNKGECQSLILRKGRLSQSALSLCHERLRVSELSPAGSQREASIMCKDSSSINIPKSNWIIASNTLRERMSESSLLRYRGWQHGNCHPGLAGSVRAHVSVSLPQSHTDTRVPPCRHDTQTHRFIPEAGHKGCF